jgi:hypothetical protein
MTLNPIPEHAERIRFALALELGWQYLEHAGWWLDPEGREFDTGCTTYDKESGYWHGRDSLGKAVPPRYPEDLNALHGVVDHLADRNPYFLTEYTESLLRLVCGSAREADIGENLEDVVCADALTRSVALLRTLRRVKRQPKLKTRLKRLEKAGYRTKGKD